MKNIAVITGTRAEYGLLKPLIQLLHTNDQFCLQLVVAAMHLSHQHGYTVSEIENDGFQIDARVDCLNDDDSAIGISTSVGVATIAFAKEFAKLSPDLIIILGDRSEMLAAATAATIGMIPIAHIHGGETTEGAYDESFRHAITKMSYLHFTSTEAYRKRVIQLGENPKRVFNVGALGIDSIISLNLLNRQDFETAIDSKLSEKNILITFHPVTLENNSAQNQFQVILDALLSLDESVKFIFTHANADRDGRVINKMIVEFVSENPGRAIHFQSLGQTRFLSSLKHIDLIVGNSSSGILEAPSFNIPTINIGDRQKGRVMAKSVINTPPTLSDIQKSIAIGLSDEFRSNINGQKQVYGNGTASKQIIKVLSHTKINNLKKSFYDIHFDHEV